MVKEAIVKWYYVHSIALYYNTKLVRYYNHLGYFSRKYVPGMLPTATVTSLKIPNVYSCMHYLFHWFDHHFSVMRICVWGVRLDHSFQYWLISAVGQCGGLGRRARPLALCEGYPNIVQACDDSKAGCANKRLVYPFSGPSGRGGTYAAGARLRHATVANHVLLLHHSPPSKAALHSVLSWLTRLFHPSMSCTGADLLYCSTRLCSTYVVGAGLWMGVLSTHK